MSRPEASRRPAAYPGKYELRLCTRDGLRLAVRPVLPEDADGLVAMVRSADPVDVRNRFLLRTDLLTDDDLARLAHVDYVDQFRLLGIDARNEIVAAASYRRVPAEGRPGTADFAVAVAPGWRRQGLGTQMLGILAERAAECGIEQFTAGFSPDNRPFLALVCRAGAWILTAHDTLIASLPVSRVLLTDPRASRAHHRPTP